MFPQITPCWGKYQGRTRALSAVHACVRKLYLTSWFIRMFLQKREMKGTLKITALPLVPTPASKCCFPCLDWALRILPRFNDQACRNSSCADNDPWWRCLFRSLVFSPPRLVFGAERDSISTVATACKRDATFLRLNRDSPLKSFVFTWNRPSTQS